MPFIGKSPKAGNFILLDSITTSATATYNLTKNSAAYFPVSARNLIVSLNGITQAPDTAYSVSGSTITFASALTSSDVIDYILVLGEVGSLGTPADNTVGIDQLNVSDGTNGQVLTTNGNGTLSFSTVTATETDTLDSVTGRGNTTTNSITVADATVTGNLTVDTDTLYVDATNDRVGINQLSPAEDLHITGSGDTRLLIEGTGSQFPTTYNGVASIKLNSMQSGGLERYAIWSVQAPSTNFEGSTVHFSGQKSVSQLNNAYVGATFQFYSGNGLACKISDEGVQAASFQTTTTGSSTAITLSDTGRVTTGENLVVTGNVGVNTGSSAIASKLDVVQGTNDTDVIRLYNSPGSSGSVQGKTYIGLDHWGMGGTYPSVRLGVIEETVADYDASFVIQTRSSNSDIAPTTRVTVAPNGNVRIGGSGTPLGVLHVSSDTSGDCVLVLEADTDNNNEADSPQILFMADGGIREAGIMQNDNFLDLVSNVSSASGIRFFVGTTNNYTNDIKNGATEEMRLEADGDLHVDGDVVSFSTTVSDQRLKDNIETIDSALDKVDNLRGVTYTWNKGSRQGERDLGVIAQEVEAVIPEIVQEKTMALLDGETYKTVDYEKLTAVLIEAVKELKAEVDALKAGL